MWYGFFKYPLPSIKLRFVGIIAKQASKNSLSILLGTLAGAINTILVLPRAFEQQPDLWGLIAVLISWAVVISQIFSLGSTNLLIRFFPKADESEQPYILSFGALTTFIGTALMSVILLLFGLDIINFLNPHDAEVISNHRLELWILCSSLIFFALFSGYFSARLRTPIIQFLQEVVLKCVYLFSALLFWFEVIPFTAMLWLIVASYVAVSLYLIFSAFAMGFTPKWPIKTTKIKDWFEYQLFSILDRGANIIVGRMDILMISALIGLSDVAFYTVAFYIGAVTQLPQKSIMAIANPIASKAIGNENWKELETVYEQSARMQLLLGGFMFCCIWATLDHFMLLFPEKFRGAEMVVFYIGLSKLFFMATGISGAILVYSDEFRKNFILNVSLIVITLFTNLYFISENGLNMGIEGAALATAITFAVYNLGKVIIIQKRFKMNPFSKKFFGVCLAISMCTPIGFWKLDVSPFLGIVIKGGIAGFAFATFALILNLAPEAKEFLLARKK